MASFFLRKILRGNLNEAIYWLKLSVSANEIASFRFQLTIFFCTLN